MQLGYLWDTCLQSHLNDERRGNMQQDKRSGVSSLGRLEQIGFHVDLAKLRHTAAQLKQ